MEKLGKVKTHFKENWKSYALLGAGVALGAAATYVLLKDSIQNKGNLAIVNTGRNSEIHIHQDLVRRGHPGYRIRVNETGEEFASVRRAAEALNIPRAKLHDYIRGDITQIDGLTFVNLGEM